MPDGFRIASAYVVVTLDQDQLDADLAEVDAKLAAIRDLKITPSVDQRLLDTELAAVQAKLDTLKVKALSEDGIDQGELDASIAEIKAKLDAISVGGLSVPVTFEVSRPSLASAIAAAKAAFASQAAAMPVSFNVSQPSLTAAVAKAKAFFKANPATMPVNLDVNAGSLAAAASLVTGFSRRLSNLGKQAVYATASLVLLDAELDRKRAALAGTALDAGALGVVMAALTAKTAAAGNAASAGARGWTIWGQNAATAIHWIISGSAELLAVLIPATVAAGAWAFAWVQGATNIYQHLNALFTATESLGQAAGHTMGEVLGLNGAWQAAQNAANVNVYQAWGSALLVVKEQFSTLAQTGLQVGHIFDTFAAKMVYDFSSAGGAGKTMNAVLSGMVPDLTRVGEVFGNLGHFLASAASQMPGLAEILLHLLADFIGAASAVAQFADKLQFGGFTILTAAMAVEEFMRWGGLLVPLLNKMGLATAEMGDKFLSFTRFQGVILNLFNALPLLLAKAAMGFGALLRAISPADSALNRFGVNIGGLGSDLEEGLRSLNVWEALGITAAAVALGFLIDKLVTARTATQQWADTLVSAAQSASNATAINTAANALIQLNLRLQQSQQAVKQFNDGWKGLDNTPSARVSQLTVGIQNLNTKSNIAGNSFMKWLNPIYDVSVAWNHMAGNEAVALANTNALRQAQQQIRGVITNVAQGATYLANTYHLTLPQAMALATTAGVSLTQNITGQGKAADIARAKVASLVEGYQAMGVPMGQVGNDMLALDIQAGDQGTQVQKVTQAWQDFMSNLTAGTSGLGSFEESLTNMTQVVATAKNNLGASAGISLSVKQFATSLKSFMGTGAQAWQNFGQVVGSTVPQVVSWMQTAQSEGAMSFGSLRGNLAEMISQLLPYAKDSKAATAELSGLAQMASGPATDSFTTLKAWVDKNKVSAKQMGDSFDNATIKMGNMAQIAANLGNVLNQQVSAMMEAAKIKASGLQGALDTLASAMQNNTLQSQAGQSARQQVIQDLEKAGFTAQDATNWVNAYTGKIHENAAAASATHTARQQITADIQKLGQVLGPTNTAMGKNSQAIVDQAVKAAQSKGARQQLITDIETLGHKADMTTGQIAGMIAKILKIPKSEAFQLLMTGKGSYTIAQEGYALTHPAGSAPPAPLINKARGGLISGPGGPTGDKVPAWLSAGEYVVRAASVDKYGKQVFDALNAQRFAEGGFAESGNTSVLSGQYTATMTNAFQASVTTALVGAMQAALHTAEIKAASGTGGYAGPGGGTAAQNQALARSLFPFPGSQWQDFVNVVMAESGFNQYASNPSGAYGIAQALPASKYPLAGRPASEGGSSNPTAQLTWMFDYIRSRYITPAAAWQHEAQYHWYDQGGQLMPGVTMAVNTTGRPETVLPNSGGINVNFYGTSWPTPEQTQAFTLALTSAIANA